MSALIAVETQIPFQFFEKFQKNIGTCLFISFDSRSDQTFFISANV